MKFFRVFSVLMVVTPAVFAKSFLCEKAKIERNAYLVISTPDDKDYITPYVLCGEPVDVVEQCRIRETATSIKVSCDEGTNVKFSLDENAVGTITCTFANQVPRILNVGTCVLK